MAAENKKNESEYEYTYPDEYPRPTKDAYATEEEWQAACKTKLSKKEWREEILNRVCFIPQTKVQSLLNVVPRTVKNNIRPFVPHLNLMDKKTKDSRYNEAYFFYDKQELKKFLLQPEKLQRRSIYINIYAYPKLISEGTIKMVQEFMQLKKAGKKYIKSDITRHLKAFFEPFYVAHCRENPKGKIIREQCPLMECSLEEDVELEQLWNPSEKGKKLDQAVFEQGLIQVALFGYTIRNGRPAAKSRIFIRSSQPREEQAEPENGEQWVLVGYEAWQRFLKQNGKSESEQPAAAEKPTQPKQKESVEAEAAAPSKEPLEENQDFTRIAEEIVSGKVKHLFITGEAGTGKTVCICKLVKELLEAGKKICLCATTGIAAENLNNTLPEYFSRAGCEDEKLCKALAKLKCRTVHDAFSLNANQPIIFNHAFEDISEKTVENIKNNDVFIIDEISMLRMDVFSKVMYIIKQAEQDCSREKQNDSRQCGAKQVIVVGDFFQLPPVITDDDKKMLLSNGWPEDWIAAGGYCFFSPWWDFQKEELKQNYRQKADSELLEHLKVVRTADRKRLKETVAWLNQQSAEQSVFNDTISIVSTKLVADQLNQAALSRLPGPVQVYDVYSKIENEAKRKKQLQSLNLSPRLELKCGARVMATKNDMYRRFVNGSMGSVTELGDDFIKVKFDRTGKVETVKRVKFDILYDAVSFVDMNKGPRHIKKPIDYVEQFPLQLAYAITIHKSQGLTLTKAKISPESWENGQLYTALSRVKSAQGLCLTAEIKEKHIKTSPKVLAFYADNNLGLSKPPEQNELKLFDNIDSHLKNLVRNYIANKTDFEKATDSRKSILKPYLDKYREQIADLVSVRVLKVLKAEKNKHMK